MSNDHYNINMFHDSKDTHEYVSITHMETIQTELTFVRVCQFLSKYTHIHVPIKQTTHDYNNNR